MSEEEIIEFLKTDIAFNEQEKNKRTEMWVSFEKATLDLIDKLQEENKYLKQRNKVIEIITNDLPSDTEFVIMTRKGFENHPTCDYISKVKIRDKIKELKIKRGKSGSSIYGYGIYFLEELLKEE